LIKKEETTISKLSEEEQTNENGSRNHSSKTNLQCATGSVRQQLSAIHHHATRIHAPYERNEPKRWWRNVRMGNMPEMYNLVVNTTLNWHSILNNKDKDAQESLVKQA
jgi:molecular chaperone HtpG